MIEKSNQAMEYKPVSGSLWAANYRSLQSGVVTLYFLFLRHVQLPIIWNKAQGVMDLWFDSDRDSCILFWMSKRRGYQMTRFLDSFFAYLVMLYTIIFHNAYKWTWEFLYIRSPQNILLKKKAKAIFSHLIFMLYYTAIVLWYWKGAESNREREHVFCQISHIS